MRTNTITSNWFINDEHKVRITLSNRALITMAEDMDIFGVSKASTFINQVFDHFKSEAKASISIYLQKRKLELDCLFSEIDLNSKSKNKVINHILSVEVNDLCSKIKEKPHSDKESKLYHINNQNVNYLLEDCEENQYYSRPGQYIRYVIEECCSLPFIERERIYRKDIYEIVERACQEKRILKVKAPYFGKEETFYVYPYKIEPDEFHTVLSGVLLQKKRRDRERQNCCLFFNGKNQSSDHAYTKISFKQTGNCQS